MNKELQDMSDNELLDMFNLYNNIQTEDRGINDDIILTLLAIKLSTRDIT